MTYVLIFQSFLLITHLPESTQFQLPQHMRGIWAWGCMIELLQKKQ
jgi:hypothetical protein